MAESSAARSGAAEAAPAAGDRPHGTLHHRAWRFQLLTLVLAAGFGLLALLAHTVLYFPVDLTITRNVQSVRVPWLDSLLGGVSWIGFPPESNVIFGAIILAIFLAGRRWEAAMALFAAAGSAALWFVVAPLVNRPRPSPDLVNVTASISWGSFPSGHVLNLTAFFGFLFFLAYVLPRPSMLRALALVVCGAIIAVIGIARVYSGEHWPSDVLGGYMLGGLWLAISIHLYHWGKHRLAERGGGAQSGGVADR